MIAATCPSCFHEISAPDEYAGKRVKCPQCKTGVEVPAPAAFDVDAMLTAPPAKPKAPSGPSYVCDEAAVALLRAISVHARDIQERAVLIERHTKRVAFWVTVVGIPFLAALMLFTFVFFRDFVGGLFGR